MVDGDTLRLSDGQLLRLTGINTPELGRNGAPDQPLALLAKTALSRLIDQGGVTFEPAVKRQDHYGRLLGAVFVRGRHAAGLMLEQGMGWHIVVPPDTRYADCFAKAEQQAKNKKAGVWQSQRYPALSAARVAYGDSGFKRIRGRITRVSSSRHSWWLELDHRVAIKLDRRDLKYFDSVSPKKWLGKTLQLRGWLVYRGRSKRGYLPWIMPLRHPAMLEKISG